jgi:hypothetical protein
MKACVGVDVWLHVSWHWLYMELSGQIHNPSDWMEGWVGISSCLGALNCQDSKTARPARRPILSWPSYSISKGGRMYVVEVEVTLRLTVSQSVSMYCFRAHSGTCDQTLLPVGTFRYCFCGAPSLMRGRVCSLQCNHPMVRVTQNP